MSVCLACRSNILLLQSLLVVCQERQAEFRNEHQRVPTLSVPVSELLYNTSVLCKSFLGFEIKIKYYYI